ncbi:acyltransferase family protein [Corynebacterium suedekumii]|nr:acyltransferase family protein [Corynebacterium suedekumii]
MDTVAAQINRILDPLRMPLFFLVSGFFSAKVFRFSFADLFQRRLWFFLVPYLVWGPVELWLKFREYHMFDHSPMPALSVYVDQLTVGKSMYWFLYALVVFNVILWLTRKLPTWAGIAVGFAPILILPLHLDYHMVGKAVLYLPALPHRRTPAGADRDVRSGGGLAAQHRQRLGPLRRRLLQLRPPGPGTTSSTNWCSRGSCRARRRSASWTCG